MNTPLQFRMFRNHYLCDACPNEWSTEMNVIQYDHCPACDREVEPYSSETLLEDATEEEDAGKPDSFGIVMTEHPEGPRHSRFHAIHADFPSSIGMGFSDRDAIRDLLEIMEDAGEISHDEMMEAMRIYGTQPYRDPDHDR